MSLCLTRCASFRLNLFLWTGVYNDCVSVLPCVSLGGGIWLSQSVYMVVHFCAHLCPPLPTPGGNVFTAPRVPGKDKEHSLTL